MLEWCSSSEIRISSPSFRKCAAWLKATRLIASLAPRVKTTSFSSGALMKAAMRARVASNFSVATWER